jgi:hypothetical protein
MEALYSDPMFPSVDSHDAQEILLSTQDTLAKRNRLRDLSVEILYKTCSLAGIDTSTLPLQRRSVYPSAEAMIGVLVDHQGVGFTVCFPSLFDIKDHQGFNS